MPTRSEMIAALKAQDVQTSNAVPSREQMIEELQRHDAESDKAAHSGLQSTARGLAQGVSLGFADELSGAAEALWQKAKGDPSEFGKLYEKHRDESRAHFKAAKDANPISYGAGEVLGGVGTAMIPGLGATGTLAKTVAAGAAGGALSGLGNSDSETIAGKMKDAALGMTAGSAFGAVGHSAAGLVKAGAKEASNSLRRFAEKSAVNATGATGVQAEKFAETAGRELLDRKIVRFGSNQVGIAERAGAAVEQANKQISSALAELESSGVGVNARDVYSVIRSKIQSLKSDPSKADVARMMEKELSNLVDAAKAKGSTKFGINEAENVKRGFNRKAGNWMDPEKGMVGKEVYQTWRKAVEDAANKADPTTAKLFEEGKATFGLLKPIQEAAERRAITLGQSQPGNLLDVATSVLGASSGNPAAIAAPIARRVISPRISSMLAVTADKVSKTPVPAGVLTAEIAKRPSVTRIGQNAVVDRINPQAILPKAAQNEDSSEFQDAVSEAQPKSAPLRGRAKWTDDGITNVIEHTGDESLEGLRDQAQLSPRMQNLLIQASDLKPNSKAMNVVLQKIRAELEKENS